jgi:tRNA-Thr(GGU) m(6)t(6)A37 methyltransferase TsaA
MGKENSFDHLILRSIGKVKNKRLEIEDDNWGSIESIIEIDSEYFSPDVTRGLENFSHLEVIFYMNQVDDKKIVTDARHPRNNVEWPKVGILAQRGKNRVNKIGVTRCKILAVDKYIIRVLGLDAVNNSPVLDIKPWVKEFAPQGKVRQPDWMTQLMKRYWK